jgi:hypothetical protein
VRLSQQYTCRALGCFQYLHGMSPVDVNQG